MSGAGFILAINLSVAGLLAAAFLAFSVFEKSYVCARWFALGYAFGALYYIAEFLVPLLGTPRATSTLSYLALIGAMYAFNVGLARMYAVRVPWHLMTAVLVIAIAVKLSIVDGMDRGSFTRMTLYQSPFFLMQAVGTALVLSAARPRPLDRSLALLVALNAVQFMIKPFLFAGNGGIGSGPDTYHLTQYAMISQAMGTVCAFATALLLLVILAADLLSEVRSKSVTDALSGVMNRRGFQENLQNLLDEPRAGHRALSLVVCDLDNFKSVNDTYGHAVGDNVIAAFADTLTRAAPEQFLVARMGGEEFAVIVPASISTARQFAEQVRTAFAVRAIDGLPHGTCVTASFGVAERNDDEHWADLLDRADQALYGAKRDGRDCVRIAATPRGKPVEHFGHAVSPV